MALLDIVLYPEPALTTAGEDVNNVDQNICHFLDDLADTMYNANGIGLAANQVGDLRRICVIDVSEGEERDSRNRLIELINPRITHSESEIQWEEGCLSFPQLFEKVTRAGLVRVSALNRHGDPFEIEGEGLLAVALQHEIDHLDGILFIDRVSRLKKRMALKRYRRILEKIHSETGAQEP